MKMKVKTLKKIVIMSCLLRSWKFCGKKILKLELYRKKKIQDLIGENERLLFIISALKLKLREVHNKYDQTMKSVKMLNSGSENLNLISSSGKSSSKKYGLGFDSLVKNISPTTGIKFVLALVNVKSDPLAATKVISLSLKVTSWVCHYCGKRGHIRPFCYSL